MYSLILKQYTEFTQSYNLTMEMNSKVQDLSTEMNSLNEKIKVGCFFQRLISNKAICCIKFKMRKLVKFTST